MNTAFVGCLLQKGHLGQLDNAVPDLSQTDLMLQLKGQRRGGILRWCLAASMAA